MVDEGNLYHRFYGIRCQFYVLQICGISREEQAPPLHGCRMFLRAPNGRFVNRPYDGTINFVRSRGRLCAARMLGASRRPRPTRLPYIFMVSVSVSLLPSEKVAAKPTDEALHFSAEGSFIIAKR